MGVLTKAVSLVASISLLDQVGLSLLGTLNAPLLPKFLPDSALSNGFPWGTDTTRNTNPYHDSPTTGKIRKYDFTLTRALLTPDGFERNLIVVNGQYPGPTIEANWGDTIEVTVHNDIQNPVEGTSVHWHGFLQHNNAWMDGTPGFTQCPIAPGKSFTYTFKAELFGTSWYHAHYSAQYADGAFGPIVVYGPWDKAYDVDIGPVVLNDYYHVAWQSMIKNITAPRPNQPPPMPRSDNNLINGKMTFDCSSAPKGSKCSSNAGMSQFRFRSGKSHRLRLMNTGADATQQFSIDGHDMIVVANDFVAVEPYTTNVVTLGVGQRTDVVIEGRGDPKSAYWMRSNATCSNARQPAALAVVFYEDADTGKAPTTRPQQYAVGCANDALTQTVPQYSMAVKEPETTISLDVTVGQDAAGIWRWYMNKSSFRTELGNPVLDLAKVGNTSYPNSPQWNVYDTGTNSSYRVVLNNKTPLAHPMHLHGHNMYIVDVGVGAWDGMTVRPDNPQRRDTQMVPANGYMVVQADADNPGAWDFHCHILWHSSSGFGIDILEQPEHIEGLSIPNSNYQTCKDWNAFVATGQIAQIDAGS